MFVVCHYCCSIIIILINVTFLCFYLVCWCVSSAEPRPLATGGSASGTCHMRNPLASSLRRSGRRLGRVANRFWSSPKMALGRVLLVSPKRGSPQRQTHMKLWWTRVVLLRVRKIQNTRTAQRTKKEKVDLLEP